MTVASGGGIAVSYSAPGSGGMPYLFMSAADVNALKLCNQDGFVQASNSTQLAPIPNSASASGSASGAAVVLAALGMVTAAFLAA